MNWFLAESIRVLIRQSLDPEQAERLLVELERLFQRHGIYKPADWPDRVVLAGARERIDDR